MTLQLWLLVFLNMATLDIAWVGYNRAIAINRAVRAGLWSVALTLLGAINMLAAVHNPWYLTATGLGAFCGTLVGMYISKRLENED